jgi:short-subunit dehydrogenase
MRKENLIKNKPLDKKTVVITGASSGAGRAAAIRFAVRHCKLVLASRNGEALQDVAEECKALGANVLIVTADVTDAEAVQLVARKAVEVMGDIDVWINNAGVLAVGALNDIPVAVHAQVIKTNLMGYMHGAYAVLPYFKAQGYGIIINNISVGGFLPVAYGTSYSASKFGLLGFFEALQSELSPYANIHVCNMYPAFLDTPGVQHAANYTGVYLRPAPPVFDPMHVADVMVKLVQYPQSAVTTDVATPFLNFAYTLMPQLTRKMMEKVMRTYFKNAPAMPATEGNTFNPVNYGNAVYGGWNSAVDSGNRNRVMFKGLLLAGALAAGIFLFKTKKQPPAGL